MATSIYRCIELKKFMDEQSQAFNSKNEKFKVLKRGRRFVKSKVTSQYLDQFQAVDTDLGLSEISKIEKISRCKIFVWTRPSIQSKWDCIRSPPYMPSNSYDNFVDIIVQYSNDLISLKNAGLILDVDESFPEHLRLKKKKFTLLEAVAIQKNPNLISSVGKTRLEVQKLEEIWGKNKFYAEDSAEFRRKFKLSLQLWRIIELGDNKIFREKLSDRRGTPKLIGTVHK